MKEPINNIWEKLYNIDRISVWIIQELKKGNDISALLRFKPLINFIVRRANTPLKGKINYYLTANHKI